MITETARAKINLSLHVTARRADGYHLLDSLVAFAEVGDRLHFAPDPEVTLALEGPFAAGLAAEPDNLVLRAARALGAGPDGARITLDKQLPVASGMGGGSADAAATLRGLARLWGRELPGDQGLALGADVPVCLAGHSARMRGVGEQITRVRLPRLPAVLVNPGIAVATGAVFAALDRFGPPMPEALPVMETAREAVQAVAALRNDLEAPARRIAPAVDAVLTAIRAQEGALLARMSGSGATCFGLFTSDPTAQAAAAALRRAAPDWWCVATRLG